jgi:hypothetical protein
MSGIDEIPLAQKLFGRPHTRTGWWSAGLALAFGVLLLLTTLWGHRQDNLRPGVWFDPLGVCLLMSTAMCGIGGGFAGAVAILRQRERSLVVFLAVLLAVGVLLFGLGQVSSHVSQGLSRG